MRIREVGRTDYEAMAEVIGEISPELAPTAEMLEKGHEALGAEGAASGHLAAEQSGRLVVWGSWIHRPSVHPSDVYEVQIHARPDCTPDVAGALGGSILEALRTRGARRAQCRLSQEQDGSLFVWLGFVEQARHEELALDLTAFSADSHQPLLEGMTEVSVELRSYDALRGVPERNRKLYELRREVHRDIPSPASALPPDYEAFEHVLERSGLIPTCSQVALHQGRFVGWTEVTRYYLPGTVFVSLTGVLSSLRKRGLASALKVTSAAAAQREGYCTMLTLNHAENVGMLRVNHQLGFRSRATWVTFARDL